MSLLPIAVLLALINGVRPALQFFFFVSVCSVALAFRGLWRNAAYKFFPAYVILYAPLWMLERAMSVYWALYWRVVHGGYPFGEQMLVKGTGRAWFAARACMSKPQPHNKARCVRGRAGGR